LDYEVKTEAVKYWIYICVTEAARMKL